MRRLKVEEDSTDWSAQAWRNSRVYKESDIDLTWKEILRLMVLDVKEGEKCVEKRKRIQLIDEPDEPKKGRKKAHCYRGEVREGGMVKCSMKLETCRQWYHIYCVEKREKKVLERTNRGGVLGDFNCALCTTAAPLLGKNNAST